MENKSRGLFDRHQGFRSQDREFARFQDSKPTVELPSLQRHCTFCNMKGHLVEICWKKQKLIRSKENKKDKEPVVKNEANVNEDSAVVTTPFILIGVTDDQGNLLQVVAESGPNICAVNESKVLQAEHIVLPSRPQTVRFMRKSFVTSIGYCFFGLNYHGNKFKLPCLVFKDEDVFQDIILGNSFMRPREHSSIM